MYVYTYMYINTHTYIHMCIIVCGYCHGDTQCHFWGGGLKLGHERHVHEDHALAAGLVLLRGERGRGPRCVSRVLAFVDAFVVFVIMWLLSVVYLLL